MRQLLIFLALISTQAQEVWRPGPDATLAGPLTVTTEDGGWLLRSAQGGWNTCELPGSGLALSGWRELHLDLANPGSTALDVVVQLHGAGADDLNTGFTLRLPAGWRGAARLPVEHLRYSFSGWHWGEPYAPLVQRGWGRLPSGHVRAIGIGLTEPGTVRLGAIRLDGALPATAWVDAWGQRAAGDWPGKVSADADLAASDQDEQTWLAVQAPLPGRDAFQAWNDGPQLSAPRFFTTVQHGGRWWLLAPSGKLFLSTGVCVVIPGLHAPVRETAAREAYTWIPPRDGLFADTWRGEEVSHGIANLIRCWGADWKAQELRRTVARQHAWGFTSLGNWADEAVVRVAGLPWVNLGPNHWWPRCEPMRVPTITPLIHDAYHPDFAAESARLAQNSCARHADDPLLIGHFILNEVGWNRFAEGLLSAPAGLPARRAFTEHLAQKYASDDGLAAAWQQPGATPETLRWPWKHDQQAPAAAQTDMTAFRSQFAERWFSIWSAAIRAADPNHLILGCRLHADERYPEVVRACGRHCDVLSVNQYQLLPDTEELQHLHGLAGRPILIGEFGHFSRDNGLLTTAVPVPDQHTRSTYYRRYTESLLSQSSVVGGHVFQYWDEPITGRFDTETSANGFLAVTGIPWPHLRDAARATGERIYAVASGAIPPWTGEP